MLDERRTRPNGAISTSVGNWPSLSDVASFPPRTGDPGRQTSCHRLGWFDRGRITPSLMVPGHGSTGSVPPLPSPVRGPHLTRVRPFPMSGTVGVVPLETSLSLQPIKVTPRSWRRCQAWPDIPGAHDLRVRAEQLSPRRRRGGLRMPRRRSRTHRCPTRVQVASRPLRLRGSADVPRGRPRRPGRRLHGC